MDKYIRTYDSVFNEEQCLHYISLINNGQRNPGKFIGADGTPTVDDKVKKAEDICISNNYPDEVPLLMQTTSDLLCRYEKDINIQIPCVSLEKFRGRIYRKGEGFYKPHVDNANKPITYSRMLTIIFYLNDIFEGGELHFEYQNVTVEARAGRAVCFPSYWMYRHGANPSLDNDRYIIRTFVKGYDI